MGPLLNPCFPLLHQAAFSAGICRQCPHYWGCFCTSCMWHLNYCKGDFSARRSLGHLASVAKFALHCSSPRVTHPQTTVTTSTMCFFSDGGNVGFRSTGQRPLCRVSWRQLFSLHLAGQAGIRVISFQCWEGTKGSSKGSDRDLCLHCSRAPTGASPHTVERAAGATFRSRPL